MEGDLTKLRLALRRQGRLEKIVKNLRENLYQNRYDVSCLKEVVGPIECEYWTNEEIIRGILVERKYFLEMEIAIDEIKDYVENGPIIFPVKYSVLTHNEEEEEELVNENYDKIFIEIKEYFSDLEDNERQYRETLREEKSMQVNEEERSLQQIKQQQCKEQQSSEQLDEIESKIEEEPVGEEKIGDASNATILQEEPEPNQVEDKVEEKGFRSTTIDDALSNLASKWQEYEINHEKLVNLGINTDPYFSKGSFEYVRSLVAKTRKLVEDGKSSIKKVAKEQLPREQEEDSEIEKMKEDAYKLKCCREPVHRKALWKRWRYKWIYGYLYDL